MNENQSNKPRLLIIGGGGHCKACIDVIESVNSHEIVGIIDLPERVGESVLNYKIIGSDSDLPELIKKYESVFVALGQIKSSALRRKVSELARKSGAKFPFFISPMAHFSRYASIDEGSIVMHKAVVQAEARIGKFCIINDMALMEHDSSVGDFTHVSTSAVLNGNVVVGMDSFIGSGAIIHHDVTVEAGVIVGAGAIVRGNLQTGIVFK